MKNLDLKQILINALEGKNGFHKITNSRDEKIAKMIYSSLNNIDEYYANKNASNPRKATILNLVIIKTSYKYMTYQKGKVTSFVSFEKMPDEKVEQLENINKFFEKNNVNNEVKSEGEVSIL